MILVMQKKELSFETMCASQPSPCYTYINAPKERPGSIKSKLNHLAGSDGLDRTRLLGKLLEISILESSHLYELGEKA